ncbi:MAG: hypothetical protein GY820_02785 [Gammaproteobacteria bacterium]|nr:hypothetical protein [Gammaproteobacteria bacterium]
MSWGNRYGNSANKLRVVLGVRAECGPYGYRWQKVAQKPKSKWEEIELRYCRHSIRLDELIILVYLTGKIG